MIDQDDWRRLARFATGECTADEADEVARWVSESAERQEALAFVRDLDVATEIGRPQWDTDTAWGRLTVRRRAQVRKSLQLLPGTSVFGHRPWTRMVAAAAAAVVTLASGVAVWQLSRSAHPGGLSSATELREYVTPRARRTVFRLPDGSVVMLAAASRLRYSPALGANGRPREVYLEGQALFQVTHDERRPFLVHTAHGVTEDLGTRFTVQEYDRDTVVQVVVAEGRVELRMRDREAAGAVLRPGQLGRLSRNGDATVRSSIDLAHQLAWTEGRLVYEETPLADALPELGRWYDMDFVLADSALGARHLTATFAGEAITETLTLLSSALGVEYERHGRTVTFRPRGAP